VGYIIIIDEISRCIQVRKQYLNSKKKLEIAVYFTSVLKLHCCFRVYI